MGKNSAIEWCYHTFNPWWGCTKISAGCKFCYAETLTARYTPNNNFWGTNGDRRFFGDKHWRQPLLWNAKAEKADVRERVFCGSMCDVFEDRFDLIKPRNKLFDLIHLTPHLDWLLLTKRPENIEKMFDFYDPLNKTIFHLHNIWLGTSVENQEMADKRIPELVKIPAKVRFLSCEPLLENIRLDKWFICASCNGDTSLDCWACASPGRYNARIDWIICGGESGPRKRHFDPDWARDIRNQCKEAGVPYFFKQVDKVKPIPDDLMIREFPK